MSQLFFILFLSKDPLASPGFFKILLTEIPYQQIFYILLKEINNKYRKHFITK